ncbi:MAG: triose-phosphate isomerase family protein [Candidatus Roizmanbacteria bacterium]
MKYIFANWKANKSFSSSREWMEQFIKILYKDENVQKAIKEGKIKIVIFPPAPLIHPLHHYTLNIPNLSLGSQDISAHESGSLTGEITAQAVSELVRYTLIGHSERRKYFNETEDEIYKKILLAHKYDIEPIHCIGNIEDKLYSSVKYIAFEPVESIGTGMNMSIDAITIIKNKLNLNKEIKFIYGGSVNQYNCDQYLESDDIDGLLVGSASLDPLHFYSIIAKATT